MGLLYEVGSVTVKLEIKLYCIKGGACVWKVRGDFGISVVPPPPPDRPQTKLGEAPKLDQINHLFIKRIL